MPGKCFADQLVYYKTNMNKIQNKREKKLHQNETPKIFEYSKEKSWDVYRFHIKGICQRNFQMSFSYTAADLMVFLRMIAFLYLHKSKFYCFMDELQIQCSQILKIFWFFFYMKLFIILNFFLK